VDPIKNVDKVLQGTHRKSLVLLSRMSTFLLIHLTKEEVQVCAVCDRLTHSLVLYYCMYCCIVPMYGVGCFWNKYIVHVPLIAHGVRIVEMSNREQRSVEMTSMNLQPPNPFCFKKTEKSGPNGDAALNSIAWPLDWQAERKNSK